jgi:hypothetical protein
MKIFKQVTRVVSKVVGSIAGFVFFVSPFTNTGLTLMAISVPVGLVCFVGYVWAEPEEDDPQNSN